MSEDGQEDISYNLFFKTLKLQHRKLYSEAEKNCWLICLPQSQALQGLKLTRETFETHLLQPSPYFQGQYVTLNKKTVEIEEDIIKTGAGFTERRQVKILFEELFYNKEYKSFRVLCIEHPLEGGAMSGKISDSAVTFPVSKRYEDCKNFLESFPINRIVLKKVKEQIQEFNDTYVLVKGYENHAAKKVQQMCSQASEALLIANPDFREFHRTKSHHLAQLNQMVDSYVIGGVHSSLFEGMRAINTVEDQLILKKMQQMHSITLTDLGVRPELHCSMPEAVAELKNLNAYITPLEKILCIQQVSGLITKAIASKTPAGDAITTDDLIPLLLYVIIQAAPENVFTNLFFMEYFTLSDISTTSLGFTLVTLRAAVEYLNSDHMKEDMKFALDLTESQIVYIPRPNIARATTPPKAERNTPSTNTPKANGLNASNANGSSVGNGASRAKGANGAKLDSLLVPKDIVLGDQTGRLFPKPPPSVIRLDKSDELGEFLSMLKEDSDVSGSRVWGNP